MKLNVDKTTKKTGLLSKKEVQFAKVTLTLSEEEKAALYAFYNPKDSGTDMELVAFHPMGETKNHPVKFRLGSVVSDLRKGKTVQFNLSARTAVEREMLVQEFTENMSKAKSIFMANAALSGDSSEEIEL